MFEVCHFLKRHLFFGHKLRWPHDKRHLLPGGSLGSETGFWGADWKANLDGLFCGVRVLQEFSVIFIDHNCIHWSIEQTLASIFWTTESSFYLTTLIIFESITEILVCECVCGCFFLVFEAVSKGVAQAGLQLLVILLPSADVTCLPHQDPQLYRKNHKLSPTVLC